MGHKMDVEPPKSDALFKIFFQTRQARIDAFRYLEAIALEPPRVVPRGTRRVTRRSTVVDPALKNRRSERYQLLRGSLVDGSLMPQPVRCTSRTTVANDDGS